MLRGGTSAAGKTGALMSGYTQYYQPCEVICYSKNTQAAIEHSRRTLDYNSYVTMEDLNGNEIRLTTCSYFQVQRYIGDGIDNASFTIQKPEIWSIWGDIYPELLKPSKRSFSIYSGLAGKEICLFRGRIITYTEIAGGSGGAINIYCNDHRLTLKRITPLQLTYEHTRYCEVHRLAFPTFVAAGLNLTIQDKDTVGLFPPVETAYTSIANAISGSPEWVASDVMALGTASGLEILGNDLLRITDSIITYATRTFADSSAFNAVEITGLHSGFVVTKEIKDDADIVKRGKISYGNVVGTEYDDLAEIELIARKMIARALAGNLSATINYNPYIIPGQIVILQSDRFNIAETIARVKLVRQQLAHGNPSTSLDGLEVIT
jgi:hypothetical protein